MNAIAEDILEIEDCWNEIGVWRKGGEECPRLADVVHCRNCDRYMNAGRVLLGRQLPEDYGNDWSNLQSRKSLTQADKTSCVIFRLGDEWFAMPVGVFSEVNPMRMIHDIPHNTSKILRGVVNIRGELKVCVSLGNLIGLTKGKKKSAKKENMSQETCTTRLVMINHDKYEVVFPVSEIAGVHRYDKNDLGKLPSTIPNDSNHYFLGSVEWKNSDVACIDDVNLFKSIAKAVG